jgi:hypothetical protein
MTACTERRPAGMDDELADEGRNSLPGVGAA